MKVPEDKQAEVWQQVLASARGKKITASLVAQVVEEHAPKKADTQTESRRKN